jgi:hypothetical protein
MLTLVTLWGGGLSPFPPPPTKKGGSEDNNSSLFGFDDLSCGPDHERVRC